MKLSISLLITGIFLVNVYCVNGQANYDLNQRTRLVYTIGANPRSRHLIPTSQPPLTVSIALYVLSITLTDVNDFSADLVMRAEREMSWTDETLSWTPGNYGGLTSIDMPVQSIYVPDIQSDNNLDPVEEINTGREIMALVTSDGEVDLIVDTVERVLCPASATAGSYDCQIKLGSNYYDTNNFDVDFIQDPPALDMTQVTRGEYDITNNVASRQVVTFSCCAGEEYAFTIFNFTVTPRAARRK